MKFINESSRYLGSNDPKILNARNAINDIQQEIKRLTEREQH